MNYYPISLLLLQYQHRFLYYFIQWVEESEWDNVIKTFCAMCEAYNQSPTEMFQQTTPEIKA